MPFPDTPILDDFNRADEGPPPSASWGGVVHSSQDGMKVVSNQLASNGNDGSAYWLEEFERSQEAYATVTTMLGIGAALALWLNIVGAGTSTPSGYLVYVTQELSNDLGRFYRADNGVFTQLGTDYVVGISVGFSARARMSEGALQAWVRNPDDWVFISSHPDQTYWAPGKIGIGMAGTTGRLDDFGGGTYYPPDSFSRSPSAKVGRVVG